MAIQIQMKREFNVDMVHAVVRMDEKTHKRLKDYMHCKDQIAIRFPTKTGLYSRGRGWYRIVCDAPAEQAPRAVQFAVKVIKLFIQAEERAVEEQIKLLAPLMRNPQLRVASYSNAHSDGEYGYVSAQTAKQRTRIDHPGMPASQHQLARLANKFNVIRKA